MHHFWCIKCASKIVSNGNSWAQMAGAHFVAGNGLLSLLAAKLISQGHTLSSQQKMSVRLECDPKHKHVWGTAAATIQQVQLWHEPAAITSHLALTNGFDNCPCLSKGLLLLHNAALAFHAYSFWLFSMWISCTHQGTAGLKLPLGQQPKKAQSAAGKYKSTGENCEWLAGTADWSS